MVNTRGSGRQQSRTSKSVATTPVKTRCTVKLSSPVRNLRSNSNLRKGHRTKPPSLRHCRNSSPQLCDPVVELSSTDSDSSPSKSASSVSANASPSTSESFCASLHQSEDEDDHTSVDLSVSTSEDEVDEGNTFPDELPRRLFFTDRYPPEGRVNSYSRAQYLVDILSVLEGSDELCKLKQSPFSSLFELPVRRCLLSGKLVHNFLARQLVTKNSHELWFTFGGYPLRFSLAEFEKVTGLLCGPYPDEETLRAAQTPANSESAYWYTLFGPDKQITIEGIVNKLKSEPRMPGWKKYALSLIVIVEGVLICGTQPVRPTSPIVEMVKDLDFFYSYPWGRHSFEYTIRMVRVGKQVCRQSQIVKKMKQPSLVLHGFPHAIQLMIFQSVPLLLRYLPSSHDFSTFYDRTLPVLPKLKTYHTQNILQVENDRELSVTHIVPILSDGGEVCNVHRLNCDPKVDHMVMLINQGYQFSKLDWRAGDASLERLCICNKKKHRRCKCGNSVPTHENSIPPSRTSHSRASATAEIATLREQITRLEKKNESLNLKLKSDLLSEMRVLFGSHKCGTCESSSRAAEHVSPIPNTTLLPPQLHTPSTPNIGNPDDFEENQGFASEFDPCNHNSAPEVEMEDLGDDNNHAFPVHISTANPVSQMLPSLPVSQSERVSDSKASDVFPSSISRYGVDVSDPQHAGPVLRASKAYSRKSKRTRPVLHSSLPHTCKSMPPLVLGIAAPGFTKPGFPTTWYSKAVRVVETVDAVPSVPLHYDEFVVPSSPSLPTDVGGGKDDESNFSDHPVNNNQALTLCTPLKEICCKECPIFTTPTVDSSTKKSSAPFVAPRIFTQAKPFKKPKRDCDNHNPFTDIHPVRIERFKRKLQRYRKDSYDIDGVCVSKTFFEDIYTPQKWLFRTHLDCMIRPFWRKRGAFLASNGIVVHDTLLPQLLCSQYYSYGSPTKSSTYVWDSQLTSYVEGAVGDRIEVTKWFRDVHTIYAPMNWGDHHWVGLLICLKSFHVEILDPYVLSTSDDDVATYMKPFMKMLPLLIKETCDPADITHLHFLPFTYDRVQRLPQTTRAADCGPFAIKLIEMHSHMHSVQGIGDIPDEVVDMFRMQYAIDVYEEFVGKVDV